MCGNFSICGSFLINFTFMCRSPGNICWEILDTLWWRLWGSTGLHRTRGSATHGEKIFILNFRLYVMLLYDLLGITFTLRQCHFNQTNCLTTLNAYQLKITINNISLWTMYYEWDKKFKSWCHKTSSCLRTQRKRWKSEEISITRTNTEQKRFNINFLLFLDYLIV